MLIKIYLIGVGFLAGALVVNVLAKLLQLPSWYDFLANPKMTLTSAVWLFIIYPFILGALVFFFKKNF